MSTAPVEELLLNFALKWGTDSPSSSSSSWSAAGGRGGTSRRPHPYRHARPDTPAPVCLLTDDYVRFVMWLRHARVVIVRPHLPDELFLMQHRLTQRGVHVEALARHAETGVLRWPHDLPARVTGIFSDPNVIRALPQRCVVSVLLPATAPIMQEVRSWRLKSMDRLDLLWAQHTQFKDFMRRHLERAGYREPLASHHFLFLSQWMLVELLVDQQPDQHSWYWPLPVYPLAPSATLAGQQHEQEHEQRQYSRSLSPPPAAYDTWVMPGDDGRSLPPPPPPLLTASFVISAAKAALSSAPGESLYADPSNTRAETREHTSAPLNLGDTWTATPPREDEPPSCPLLLQPAAPPPWSFSE